MGTTWPELLRETEMPEVEHVIASDAINTLPPHHTYNTKSQKNLISVLSAKAPMSAVCSFTKIWIMIHNDNSTTDVTDVNVQSILPRRLRKPFSLASM